MRHAYSVPLPHLTFPTHLPPTEIAGLWGSGGGVSGFPEGHRNGLKEATVTHPGCPGEERYSRGGTRSVKRPLPQQIRPRLQKEIDAVVKDRGCRR